MKRAIITNFASDIYEIYHRQSQYTTNWSTILNLQKKLQNEFERMPFTMLNIYLYDFKCKMNGLMIPFITHYLRWAECCAVALDEYTKSNEWKNEPPSPTDWLSQCTLKR